MNQAVFGIERERRLELYHERLAASLERQAASEKAVAEALSLTRSHSLARASIEFVSTEEFVPGRWVPTAGIGEAFETYIQSLQNLEQVRFSNSALFGVTDNHRVALKAVIDAAFRLKSLGWPVNWEQNVQAILDVSEFGLHNGEFVDRYQELPREVTLKDRLSILGTVTFYRQYRAGDGPEGAIKALVLNDENSVAYGEVLLHLTNEATARKHMLFRSEWLPSGRGRQMRIFA
ncbi:hypothetical protein AAIH70_15850 [Neorhizobium sp. BT27B]|uniref:hypothetical protein n=1 Tax=Neorhizobium sp. BT27B TaxID=3142625 RepID=UPI003D2690AD